MTSPSKLRVLMELEELATLHPYSKVSAKPDIVPQKGGIYAWYYKKPPNCTIKSRSKREGELLIYVGMSPRDASSTQNLFERIKTHCRHSSSSAFRRSLGKYLFGENFLSIPDGDKKLNECMMKYASVCWVELEKPWDFEEYVIEEASPLLNIIHN